MRHAARIYGDVSFTLPLACAEALCVEDSYLWKSDVLVRYNASSVRITTGAITANQMLKCAQSISTMRLRKDESPRYKKACAKAVLAIRVAMQRASDRSAFTK